MIDFMESKLVVPPHIDKYPDCSIEIISEYGDLMNNVGLLHHELQKHKIVEDITMHCGVWRSGSARGFGLDELDGVCGQVLSLLWSLSSIESLDLTLKDCRDRRTECHKRYQRWGDLEIIVDYAQGSQDGEMEGGLHRNRPLTHPDVHDPHCLDSTFDSLREDLRASSQAWQESDVETPWSFGGWSPIVVVSQVITKVSRVDAQL